MDRSKIFLAMVVSLYNLFTYSSQLSSACTKSPFDSGSSLSVLSYVATVKNLFVSSDDDYIKSNAAQALVSRSIKQKVTRDIVSDLDLLRNYNSEQWNIYMNNYRNSKSGNTLLIDAVIASDVVMIDFLYRSGVDGNARNYDRKTVLHSAVDLHDGNSLRVSPLFPSVDLISYFVLRSLEHLSPYTSIDVFRKDASGFTALDIALQENLDDSVILFLLEKFYTNLSLPHEAYLKVRNIVIKHKNQSLLARLDSQNFSPVFPTHPHHDYVQVVTSAEGNRVRSLSENDKFNQKEHDKLANHQPCAKTQSMHTPTKQNLQLHAGMPSSFDLKQQYQQVHRKK